MIADTAVSTNGHYFYLVSYSLVAVFVVLIVSILGLIFLSMGNKLNKSSLKTVCLDFGEFFVFLSVGLVIASFILVPFSAKNEQFKNEVISSEEMIVENQPGF